MLIKIIGLTVTLFICCLIGKGQQQYNLVPNYSFEQYNFCPLENNLYYIYNAKPDYWYKPDLRGATYFNSCANNTITGIPIHVGGGGVNFQYARTGNGYIVMFYYNGVDARNYNAVKLKDSLKQGKCYYAEYYINSPNTFRFGCNNQSMLFTNTPVYVDTAAVPAVYMLPANPQIQTTGYNGAAYYIEDVTVVPLDSITLQADAGLDKTITIGDSVFIGSFTTGLTNVTWYNSSGNIIANNVSGLFVKPTSSTFYVIEQTVCGQYSRDTVNVTVNTAVPLVIKNYELIIKNEAVVNNWQTLQEVNVSHFNIQYSNNGINFTTVKAVAAKNNPYNEYTVSVISSSGVRGYYRVEAVDKDGKKTHSKMLSIITENRPQTLNIYPNPTKSIITISFPQIKQIIINDITGRTIKNIHLQNMNVASIDVADLPKGMFIIHIIGNNGNALEKLIID